MASTLPDWVKLVWLVIRKTQGNNTWAFAHFGTYAEACGKHPTQGSQAVKILVKSGWLERNGRRVRCIVPTSPEVDQPSTSASPKVDQSSTQVDQSSTQVDQSSTATESRKRIQKKNPGVGAVAPSSRERGVPRISELTLDAKLLAYAEDRAPLLDPERELEKFRNYCGSKGRRMKDYRRGFQNWLIKGQEMAEENAKRFGPRQQQVKLNLATPIPERLMPRALAEYPNLSRDDFFRNGRDQISGEPAWMVRPEALAEVKSDA